MRSLGVYWWSDRRNFGDLLSPLLLSHFVQSKVHWEDPLHADIVSTGSVLDVLPQHGWHGVVAGSGKLLSTTHTDLTNAKVVGLRGHFTSKDVKISNVDRKNLVIGDPGLLASDIVNVQRDKYPLGLVAHWSDNELYRREVARSRKYHYAEPILIDSAGEPIEVIALIASCSKIISSSLHGIITADAFGIPRRAEMFPGMATNPYEGGRFKFADYASSINQPIEFGKLQEAPRVRVERIQYELFDMFTDLAGRIDDFV